MSKESTSSKKGKTGASVKKSSSDKSTVKKKASDAKSVVKKKASGAKSGVKKQTSTKKSKITELTYSPSANLLVPKHEILSDTDKSGVLQQYHVTPDLLPHILVTDPAVLEIKAKPGDVLRITRDSETAGESIYYRVVVE